MTQDRDVFRLDGRSALVTGAGGGVGEAIARAFSAAGAAVLVTDIDKDAAVATAESITAAGGTAQPFVLDVRDSAAATEATAAAAELGGGALHILVNNAGAIAPAMFADMSEENFRRVVDIHLVGSFVCSQAALAHLPNDGTGRIINVTSAAGLTGTIGQANYGAAKLGLVGLINTLAQEGAKYNIKANAVAPIAATRMTQDILPPEVFEKLTPEYVAPVVAYLCAEKLADTASVFIVGGGKVQRTALFQNDGVTFSDVPSVDDVASKWGEITDLSAAQRATFSLG